MLQISSVLISDIANQKQNSFLLTLEVALESFQHIIDSPCHVIRDIIWGQIYLS